MGPPEADFVSFACMPALESTVDMYDLRMSDEVKPLYEKVKAFIRLASCR